MKILLTGATGYIGKRLLPLLIANGHQVVCTVRDKKRFKVVNSLIENVEVVEVDLLKEETLDKIPTDIGAAYYLVHSMSSSFDYKELEEKCAHNFANIISKTSAKQVIYLSGIVNEKKLSEHLSSRSTVEEILSGGSYNFTCLRAGIIVGSGSASFEIMRDLVEKLPIMVTPKWLLTKCQPIGIGDVLKFMLRSLYNEKTYGRDFDIGGPDILTYKQMLLGLSDVRGLKRYIFTVPVMTPKLSSYWLYFVTSTSYTLASALVDSMKVEVVCRDKELSKILDIQPISYYEALERAFEKIEKAEIISSWKDSYASSGVTFDISDFLKVPSFGCFKDQRRRKILDRDKTISKVWRIGGENGWYYANWMWKIRGHLDKMVGGVGLRRGRTHSDELHAGDALDFWRVLYVDREEGRLLLFAEMKLPGEAWLEFRQDGGELVQTATFRPRGVAGRLYWYSILPFHGLIFKGMLKKLTSIQ